MNNTRKYNISIGSAAEYEDLIAEITFPKKFGLIVSQERGEGMFDVSVHSFRQPAASEFDYEKNIDDAKVPLSELKSALDHAIAELTRLKRE